MSEASKLVDNLLESEEKWNNAVNSFTKIWRLRKQSLKLYAEIARGLDYERQLVRVGLTKEEVERQIVGAQIRATDNYKLYSASDLREKLYNYVVGVETKDGRKVWFKKPVPPDAREHEEGYKPLPTAQERMDAKFKKAQEEDDAYQKRWNPKGYGR